MEKWDGKLRLFNTLGRQLQVFKPQNASEVSLYSCGPTVYNYAHIGNLRAYVFADVLVRVLRYFGHNVKHVMNITDVGHLVGDGDDGQDKMELSAGKTGLTAWDIAKKYTDAFFEHTQKLHINRPTIVCKATDHIQEQIDMVKKLEERGHTYTTSDGVYFDSNTFDRYAELAHLDIEGLRGGDRVDLGEKRNKTDFALWKFSETPGKRAMEWESPWGVGFPGWHIECSAMAMNYLGESFDIHTGGIDHIPVHHTNEVAQSECATGVRPFVHYWMHNEFLVLDKGEKMSKSESNFLTLDTLEERGVTPLAYRYFLATSHYRKALKFSTPILQAPIKTLERLQRFALEWKETLGAPDFSRLQNGKLQEAHHKMQGHLATDLNTPEAMAVVWQVLGSKDFEEADKWAILADVDKVLGLDLVNIKKDSIPADIQELAEKRYQARQNKDWALADKMRDELTAKGYEMVDSPDGFKVQKKSH